MQSVFFVFSKSQIFLTIQKNAKRKRFQRTASSLKQNMFSRREMLLFGIIFVLYYCFVQSIRLENGPIRNLFKFPDLTFSFQFSYRFFIFCCIIFDLFPQLLCSFKLQLLFHVKICLLVGRKKVLCIFSLNTA